MYNSHGKCLLRIKQVIEGDDFVYKPPDCSGNAINIFHHLIAGNRMKTCRMIEEDNIQHTIFLDSGSAKQTMCGDRNRKSFCLPQSISDLLVCQISSFHSLIFISLIKGQKSRHGKKDMPSQYPYVQKINQYKPQNQSGIFKSM